MMKSTVVVIATILLVSKYCDGQAAMEAEEALNHLRLVTSQRLNSAFLEHIRLSSMIDMTAFDTKDPIEEPGPGPEPAVRAPAADAVATCVNEHAEEALDAIAKRSSELTVALLKDIYDEEKALIVCGRVDEDCLDEVATEIRKKARQIGDIIEEELDGDRDDVDEHIKAIKACASDEDQ